MALHEVTTKFSLMVEKILSGVIPLVALVFILDLPLWITGTTLFNQQYLALFWSLVAALVFLTTPASKRDKRVGRWYDFCFAACAVLVGMYVTVAYPTLLFTLGLTTPLKLVFSLLAVFLILESTRRLVGWPIVIVVLVFILYARYGYLLPGALQTKVTPWPRLLTLLYLGDDFFLGTPLRVMALVVFPYILFGQILFQTGGGDFLINLAQSLMGKYRGGPAKVAIIASAFFGSISGSAVANVVSTGMVTIPMMKRIGYSPVFSGAVETVSSTGGVILPPVMGAVAFIMAEFLGVPYATVAVTALVPALLYYLCEYLQVDLRAVRRGLKGLPAQDLPHLKQVLAQGWFYFIPMIVLVYSLFFLRVRAEVAALYATVAIVIISLIVPRTRSSWQWRNLLGLAQQVSRGVFEITIICAAAGLVVGLLSYTGLGFSLSFFLAKIAGDSMFMLAILAAIASAILGMGMPSVACYIFLAVLVAPALVDFGVSPLAAHLFILYFGILSFLTPPVCLAAYAAAGIAGASPMAVGFQAVRLAIAGFIVPFIFLYNPPLILIGSVPEIALAIFDAVVAVLLLAIGLEGYCFRPLNWAERVLFILAGIAMFVPGWPSRILGLSIAIPLLVIQFKSKRTEVFALNKVQAKQQVPNNSLE